MKTRFLLLLMMFLFTAYQASSSVTNDSITGTGSTVLGQNGLSTQQKTVATDVSYTGDICTNMFGGIATGTKYLGMANLKVGFDTKNAKLWKGGMFFINGAVTHGKSPSELLTGDFQTVSNIDAGDHIYIHELWYQHSFNRFELIFGLQDLNVEFAGSANGSMFINSSFGIPSLISDNIPAPIFPLTSLGITGKFHFNSHVSLTAAVYDGCPTAFEDNVYNTNWHLCSEDGSLFLVELEWSTELFKLPGTYKAGSYFHSGLKQTHPETGAIKEVFAKNYGLFAIADQTVWENTTKKQSLSAFAQISLSPKRINTHHYYVGGGVNYFGISKKQPENAIGLAFACAGFKKGVMRNETTIETYYKKQIGENLTVQPDLQYVIHPAGTDEPLPNALVGILRFSLNF